MKMIFRCLIICLFFSCNSEPTNFDLCGGRLRPYYHPQLKYEGSFYDIKNHFHTSYKEINSENNNGIVRIRFHVNCKGKTGNFKIETYSLDYNLIEIDDKIIQQLLELSQKLDNWIPAKDKDGNTVDSHKFFAFKIENGKLKDILPK